MKVIKSEDNLLEFDNGLVIEGDGEYDCCAVNYIDFEQFVVGHEFPSLTADEFANEVTLKDDGFILKDINMMPKWAQARSEQNGYYSNITSLSVRFDGKTLNLGNLRGQLKDY